MPRGPGRKIERVNAALKREVGELITSWLADPRISPLTSVSRVDTSRDLAKATIYVSIYGDEDERGKTLAALDSGRVAIRQVLKEKMRIRHVPDIYFRLDPTTDEASRVLSLLDGIKQDSTGPGGAS